MTTFQIYKKLDQYEEYELIETIEAEDTSETRENLVDEYFHYNNDWDIEDDYEEYINGETDEAFFYRTSVPSHDWEEYTEGYIDIKWKKQKE